jgi:hypothetical protein
MALDKNKVCNVMLGMMGERIVAKILRDRGQQVEESLDPFDAEKDMFVDGERVEVKTQVPILTENSFAVSVRQRTKLYNCRYVYFVSVPPSKWPDELGGNVYELDMAADVKAYRWSTNNGREMICFPRNQSAMKLIGKVTDERLINTMKDLSTSYL